MVVTGAAVFSLSSSASARVITTSVNQTITFKNTANSSAILPLNVGSAPNVQFKGYFNRTTLLKSFGGVKASVGNFITNGNSTHGLKKLALGYHITNKRSFHNVSATGFSLGAPLHVRSGTKTNGVIDENQSEFVGFKLNNGDLGYIELKIGDDETTNPGFPQSFTVIGYGLNNSPGQEIDVPDSVPEPQASTCIVGMLLLAGAGSGLKEWRKRRLAP